MQTTIRILPDAPFARLVTAATGVSMIVTADPLGRRALYRLASGATLEVGAVPGPVGTAPRVSVYADAVDRLDDLYARRLELDVLCRVADLVILACRGQLNLGDIDEVAKTRLAFDITARDEDDMIGEVLTLALAHDLEVGDTGSPAECLVDLALAMRELRVMALDREAAHVVDMIDEVVNSDEHDMRIDP